MKKEKVTCIVFAGDSVTDADKAASPLGNGYVRLVAEQLVAFHPQYCYDFVNAGISGNTSADLSARWDKDVTAYNPDIVFCMIGINDVWRHFDYKAGKRCLVSASDYEKNLCAIAEKSKSTEKFYFMTPFFMESNKQDEMRVMTDEYNAVLRKVAQRYNRSVLDGQAGFDEYMNCRAGQSISWDRVHPGPIGSHIIAKLIMETLFPDSV